MKNRKIKWKIGKKKVTKINTKSKSSIAKHICEQFYNSTEVINTMAEGLGSFCF